MMDDVDGRALFVAWPYHLASESGSGALQCAL